MKKLTQLTIVICIALLSAPFSYAESSRYITVREESFYVVKPENKAEFIEIYKTKLFPFWSEMYVLGITVDESKMYSQRLHTLKPLWTYKMVVKFKNYQAVDKWLEIRDEVYDRLFPGEGGYKEPRKMIDKLTESHWDEFIREVNMEK